MTDRAGIAIVLGTLASLLGLDPATGQQGALVPPAPTELLNRRTNIVLRLSDAGSPSINDQPVAWKRLNAELGAIFEQRPEKILFIATHAENRVEDIRRVLAVAKKHGIKVYALLGRGPPR